MSGPLRIEFHQDFYTREALTETASAFADIVDISVTRSGKTFTVTVPEDEQAKLIAGEFINIALAHSMEEHSRP